MITGKFVGIRAIEKEDLSLLRDWRNIPTFRKNFREHRELGMYNQERWFEKTVLNPNDFMFVIEKLDNQKIIGAAGLLYINWIIRSADFSFYIGHDELYIDDKYAPDAIRLLLTYGFNNLNLNKVWMELYEFDKKKLKIFIDTFKFKVDGTLRQNAFEDGKYFDSHIISLLKSEFDVNNHE